MIQNGYTDTGSLKISEDVLAAIAGNATREIKGVAGLSLRPTPDSFGNLSFFHKKSKDKVIRLEIKDGEAVIDIFVSLYNGVKIPDTSELIQARVKETVQNMTGITVSKVNVHISGLIIAEAAQE
jgi:uncharacterized alkaline shock family protein YloU